MRVARTGLRAKTDYHLREIRTSRGGGGLAVGLRRECGSVNERSLRDEPLEKLWGGGIFELQESFLLLNSLYEFF